MKNIQVILRSLGLLESDIKTYLAALQHGPQTVIDLSKQTKLSRQATYVAIEAMTERGLMASVLRGKKRYYSAEDPEKLLAYAKRREQVMEAQIKDLEDSLPELKLQLGGERPLVRMFEGKDGLRAYLSDVESSHPKEIDEIADLEAVNAALGAEDLGPIRKHHAKNQTKVRGLYTGIPRGEKPSNVERYSIPGHPSGLHTDIAIYGDKIALVTLEGKMFTVLIESPALARTLRHLFELAFEHRREDKNVI